MQTLLTVLVLPPTGFLLLALAGLLTRRRWPSVLALLLALGASTEALVTPLAAAWVDAEPSAVTLQRARAWANQPDTVVLVLGAGVRQRAAADGGWDLKPLTAERLRRGHWWRHQLGLPLAFSGGVSSTSDPDAPSEAEVVAQVLAQAGLAPLAWAEARSRDTRENARLSAVELQRRGVRQVLLVTDALHMPRSLKHFRAAAPNVTFLAAPLQVERDGPTRWGDWLPSIHGARLANYLAYEVTARAVGH